MEVIAEVPLLAFGSAVGGRMKLKHDIALCFDWSVIDQCGLVAPFVESFDDGRKQAGGTEDLVNVFDAAVLGDGDFDAN